MTDEQIRIISRRSFLKSSAMLSGLALLSACTVAPVQQTTEAGGAAQEVTELRLTTWENWEKDGGMLSAWETFEETRGVTVVPEHIPWVGYSDKIVTLAATGTLPDILRVNGHMTPIFGYRDLLLSLTPFIDRDSFDMDIYYPLLKQIYQYKGEQLSLPQENANYSPTYYNVKLFEEAGLDLPPDDWTYTDLLTYAEALTKVEGGRTTQYGMVLAGSGYPSPGAIAFGGQMSDDNFAPTKANIDSEEHRALYEYLIQAIDMGVHPTAEALSELQGAATALATGRVGIIVAQGLWVSHNLISATDLEWNILVSPRREDKPHRFATAGAGWSAPAASKDPDLAWDFLQFFMGPEGTEIILAGRAPEFIWPSAIREFSEKEAAKKADIFPKLMDCVNAAEDVIPWWALHHRGEEIWTTVLGPISDQILRKEKTIDEGVVEMQTKMQAILDQT